MKRRSFLNNTIKGAAMMAIPTIVPSSVFGKNAPSNKLNNGQIGVGRIARDHDLPGTWQHVAARIMAVFELDRN